MEMDVKKQYSREWLDRLKANIRLEDVVKKNFILKKQGNNYFTSCPFCGATKAFCISAKKQFGYCFSCKKSFDVFGYFLKVDGLSFYQTMVEMKRFINRSNKIERRKLLRASAYFKDLKIGKNPITEEPIKNKLFQSREILERLTKLDWMLTFLVSDYYYLNQEKYVLPEEITECNFVVSKILDCGFRDETPDNQKRLTNLFLYVSELLELIRNNDYNLSGIVYGLK